MDAVSPELVALLAACRARPADDLPRLVLADWLDENGQPERAEFVRVQVELSHPTADAERVLELQSRASELLKKNSSRWIGQYDRICRQPRPVDDRAALVVTLGDAMPCPPWHFERGLLRLGSIDDVSTAPSFRAWLRTPEAFWLEQAYLGSWSVEEFVKADLPDELSGRIGLLLALDAQTGLRELRRAFRLLAVSSNFTAVRSLWVRGVGDGEVILTELARADLFQLIELSLNTTGGDPDRMAKQVAAGAFTALSSLNIGSISGAALRTLIRSPHLGNLTDLHLIGSKIGDGGMIALCDSRLASTLRTIRLANMNIGDNGAIALVRSPLFTNLQGVQLNLMMNHIGDAGLKALAESEHLLRFRELVFRENRDLKTKKGGIGDAGAEALAQSPYAANMRYIDFWRNNVTDRGAFALARSPYLNKVVDLCVKENQITEAGAAALHERFGEAAKV